MDDIQDPCWFSEVCIYINIFMYLCSLSWLSTNCEEVRIQNRVTYLIQTGSIQTAMSLEDIPVASLSSAYSIFISKLYEAGQS